MADVQNNKLSKEDIQRLQKDFAANPHKDPKYLASLQEALKLLLGPEDIMKRGRDRESPAQEK
jgi:hypothetical protein